jgi:hypothetical protein
MAGRKGTGAGGNNQHPPDEKGVVVRTMKSKVVAEFVDEIPPMPDNLGDKRMVFQRQEGVREALDMAFNTPGRAMVLVEYDQGSPSQRRNNAKSRVEMLNKQGYSEKSGWVVVARENKVYVLYQGEV